MRLPQLYKPMGNSLISRIFIKSAVDQTNLKLGMVITRINSIIQKKSIVSIATCLGEINFSGSIMQRVYKVEPLLIATANVWPPCLPWSLLHTWSFRIVHKKPLICSHPSMTARNSFPDGVHHRGVPLQLYLDLLSACTCLHAICMSLNCMYNLMSCK